MRTFSAKIPSVNTGSANYHSFSIDLPAQDYIDVYLGIAFSALLYINNSKMAKNVTFGLF